MPDHPLAEVFGFPTENHTDEAQRYRKYRLCPHNNRVPSCTKDAVQNPLGVCSVHNKDRAVITCPIRFRQDWLIAQHAAEFFFEAGAKWTSLTEVTLPDKNSKSAGNIDVVLVSYDDFGRVIDFGSLEVQAVYISGNVRGPFEYYMQAPLERGDFNWKGSPNYPRPDFLSSSRKRLAPQLIYKGGIIKGWGKKQAVALDESFFSTLPTLPEVSREEADIAWLVYRLDLQENRYNLVPAHTVFTKFEAALNKITISEAGLVTDFIGILQSKLDSKLDAGRAQDTLYTDDLSNL